MMKETNESTGPRLNGCGWTALAVIVGLALAFVAAILYILVSFGSFLGGL
jgi:hypothetical protein